MKIKASRIALIAAVVIVVALLFMWWGNKSKNQPGEGLTIVTPMPVSGYSIEDTPDDGIPTGLPDEIAPLGGSDQLALSATEIPTLEPIDVISEETTTAAPESDDVEEFTNFASRNWRGEIL